MPLSCSAVFVACTFTCTLLYSIHTSTREGSIRGGDGSSERTRTVCRVSLVSLERLYMTFIANIRRDSSLSPKMTHRCALYDRSSSVL